MVNRGNHTHATYFCIIVDLIILTLENLTFVVETKIGPYGFTCNAALYQEFENKHLCSLPWHSYYVTNLRTTVHELRDQQCTGSTKNMSHLPVVWTGLLTPAAKERTLNLDQSKKFYKNTYEACTSTSTPILYLDLYSLHTDQTADQTTPLAASLLRSAASPEPRKYRNTCCKHNKITSDTLLVRKIIFRYYYFICNNVAPDSNKHQKQKQHIVQLIARPPSR